jgi:hypothetical protein
MKQPSMKKFPHRFFCHSEASAAPPKNLDAGAATPLSVRFLRGRYFSRPEPDNHV